jgi:hypothetical protein
MSERKSTPIDELRAAGAGEYFDGVDAGRYVKIMRGAPTDEEDELTHENAELRKALADCLNARAALDTAYVEHFRGGTDTQVFNSKSIAVINATIRARDLLARLEAKK